MEGPELRSVPRTFLCCPVELCVGGKTIRREQAMGNVSAHGLFLQAEYLPVNTAVRIKLSAAVPIEIDGVVRFCDARGVGIEFTAPAEADRQRLAELIAAFTPGETLGS